VAASIDLPPSAALDRQAGGGGGAPAEVPANRTYQPSVVLVDNAAGSSSSRSGSPFAVAAEGAAETLRAGESSGDGSGGDGSGGDGTLPSPPPALASVRKRSSSEPLMRAVRHANADANAAPPAGGGGSPGSVGVGGGDGAAAGSAFSERPPRHSQGSRLAQRAGDGGGSADQEPTSGGGGGRPTPDGSSAGGGGIAGTSARSNAVPFTRPRGGGGRSSEKAESGTSKS